MNGIGVLITLLAVGLMGYILGYYTSMFLWKMVSDSWKYLYQESQKELMRLKGYKPDDL